MLLTIGILVSDKDVQNLENLILQIKEKVKIENEIIICNNSSNEISMEDVIIVNNGGGNIYQLRGRKLIIEQAKGDYIWFVDADDTINEVKDENFIGDIVEFNFTYINTNEVKPTKDNLNSNVTTVKTSLIDECISVNINTLWSKFIKTSILKEVAEKIPEEDVSALEDWIYIYGSMTISKSYEKSTQNIYNYNCIDTSSSCHDFSNCYERFERIIKGVTEGMKIILLVTNGKIQNYMDAPIDEYNAYYYLSKIVTTENEDVCEKMLDLIRQYFSDYAIKQASYRILKCAKTKAIFNHFVKIISQKINLSKNITKYGNTISKIPEWEDYNQAPNNLYQDFDIENNPFTLNINSGEVQIFSRKEDFHPWIDDSKKWEFHDNSVQEDTYIIHFSFGNACNLHCSYCFADKENTHEICLEEQKNVIDKVFELYSGKINHIVLNNNGEPLFNSEAFWEMYDYLKSKGLEDWQIQINSNGVDFSENDIKKLVERGGVNISIDGPKEIQDAHRGPGTYDSIIEDIQALKENDCSLVATAVIMDDEISIFNILEHLYKIGFTNHIFFSPARINGYWTDKKKERLYARYEEFYNELEKRICINHEFFWFSVLLIDIKKIKFAMFWKNCPRYSPNFLDFDGQGNIFSCYEEVGCSDKIIGNIFTSDMEKLFEKRKEVLKERNFISESCLNENCSFINFCGGKNNMCEHLDSDMLCKLEKIKYKTLLKIYAYMCNNYLPEEREFLFEDAFHREKLIVKNPKLLTLDKEFTKDWFSSKSVQNSLKDGILNKDDILKYI